MYVHMRHQWIHLSVEQVFRNKDKDTRKGYCSHSNVASGSTTLHTVGNLSALRVFAFRLLCARPRILTFWPGLESDTPNAVQQGFDSCIGHVQCGSRFRFGVRDSYRNCPSARILLRRILGAESSLAFKTPPSASERSNNKVDECKHKGCTTFSLCMTEATPRVIVFKGQRPSESKV